MVLGGAELAKITEARGQLGVNASAERLLAMVPLARRFPKAQIIFTGGYGALGRPVSAGRAIAGHLVAAGIGAERILIEDRSRNTWQNALYTKNLLRARQTVCPCGYLLVTSAWHMPRAVGVFRQAGFDDGPQHRLYPWPVDYRTLGHSGDWQLYRWFHEGLKETDLAVKEWLGLVVYWMSGRSIDVWPAPAEQPN